MKRICTYLLGLSLLVSCTRGEEVAPAGGELQRVTIGLGLETDPAFTPRSVADNTGGTVDWGAYEMRYIFEVWTTEAPIVCVHREVTLRDKMPGAGVPPVSFDVSLPNATRYDYAFWADIVEKNKGGVDLYYDTTEEVGGLTYVQIIEGRDGKIYTGNTPTRDAYCAVVKKKKVGDLTADPVTLRRPFAKLIVKATGLGGAISVANDVTVSYMADIYHSYSVLSGDVFGNFTPSFVTKPLNDYSGGEQTLTTDFVFVKSADTKVSFSVGTAVGANQVGRIVTDAPAGTNELTTVRMVLNKKRFALGANYPSVNPVGIICWVSPEGCRATVMNVNQFSGSGGLGGTYAEAQAWIGTLGAGWTLPTREQAKRIFEITAAEGETLYGSGIPSFDAANPSGNASFTQFDLALFYNVTWGLGATIKWKFPHWTSTSTSRGYQLYVPSEAFAPVSGTAPVLSGEGGDNYFLNYEPPTSAVSFARAVREINIEANGESI